MKIERIKAIMKDKYLNLLAEKGPHYQVVGERCSGTNYVDALISTNTPLKPSKLYGWKHGFPTLAGASQSTTFIVIARDVFDWLRSMYARPYHSSQRMRSIPFSDFIRCEWDCTIDTPYSFGIGSSDPRLNQILQWDRHPILGRTFKDIIELRSVKLQSHLGMLDRGLNVVYSRFESILSRPDQFIMQTCKTAGLDVQRSIILPQEHYGWHWPDRRSESFKRAAKFRDEDIDYVFDRICHTTEARAGYHYEISSVKKRILEEEQMDEVL